MKAFRAVYDFTPQESILEKDAQNPKRKDRLPIPQRKGSLFSLSFWGKNYVWWICWSSGWHNLPMLHWLLRLRALPALWTCSYKDSMPDSTKPAIKNLEKTKVGWEKSLMGKKSAHPNFPLFLGGESPNTVTFPSRWLLRLRGTGSRFVADRSSKRSAPWSFVGALESWKCFDAKRQPKRFGRKKTKQSSQYME